MLPMTAVALVSTALMLFGTPQEKPQRTQPLGTLGVVPCHHGFRGFGHSNAYHATGPTAYSLQRLTFKPESTIVENWQWLA